MGRSKKAGMKVTWTLKAFDSMSTFTPDILVPSIQQCTHLFTEQKPPWVMHNVTNANAKHFPADSVVTNLTVMQEKQVWSLGGEDPLEEGMASHSTILAWRIPWTEDPGGPQSMGPPRIGHDWVYTHTHKCKSQALAMAQGSYMHLLSYLSLYNSSHM